MLKVLTGYAGGSAELNARLAELLNVCRRAGAAPFARLLRVEDVKEMFESGWFEPEWTALVLLRGNPIGHGAVWGLPRNIRLSVCVNPMLPEWLAEETARTALSWARQALEARGFCGRTSIFGWYEHSYLHLLFRRALGGSSYVETSLWTTMVLHESEGLVMAPDVHRVRPATRADAARIVEVTNRAFSVYDWFSGWTVDDVYREFEKVGWFAFVAEDPDGEIVGHVDVELYTSVDGRKVGYIATLAVSPESQRRGVGKSLLAVAVRELISRGAEIVVLDAASGLEPLYGKLGFKCYRRWITLFSITSVLPQEQVTPTTGEY